MRSQTYSCLEHENKHYILNGLVFIIKNKLNVLGLILYIFYIYYRNTVFVK